MKTYSGNGNLDKNPLAKKNCNEFDGFRSKAPTKNTLITKTGDSSFTPLSQDWNHSPILFPKGNKSDGKKF